VCARRRRRAVLSYRTRATKARGPADALGYVAAFTPSDNPPPVAIAARRAAHGGGRMGSAGSGGVVGRGGLWLRLDGAKAAAGPYHGADHRHSDRGTTPPRRPPALAHLPLRPFSVLVTRTLGTCSRPCAAMRRGAHAALIRALTTGDMPPQGLQGAWVLRPVVAPCQFTHATRWRTPVRRAVGGSIERPDTVGEPLL